MEITTDAEAQKALDNLKITLKNTKSYIEEMSYTSAITSIDIHIRELEAIREYLTQQNLVF